MIRLLPLLLLFSIAGCASSGGTGAVRSRAPSPSARGEAAPTQEAWRKDWRAFWEAVAPYARAGAIESNRDAIPFNAVFAGEVEWVGTVRSVRVSPGIGTRVELDMPQVLVPLPDGSSVQVRELELSCSLRDPGCAGWSRELVGREVRFRTELVNRTRGYRPVVRVESFGKERRIDIQAWGAELVGAASR